jgi:hypothetical protein
LIVGAKKAQAADYHMDLAAEAERIDEIQVVDQLSSIVFALFRAGLLEY